MRFSITNVTRGQYLKFAAGAIFILIKPAIIPISISPVDRAARKGPEKLPSWSLEVDVGRWWGRRGAVISMILSRPRRIWKHAPIQWGGHFIGHARVPWVHRYPLVMTIMCPQKNGLIQQKGHGSRLVSATDPFKIVTEIIIIERMTILKRPWHSPRVTSPSHIYDQFPREMH